MCADIHKDVCVGCVQYAAFHFYYQGGIMLKCESFVVEKAVYCSTKFSPLNLQQNWALLLKITGVGKEGE